MNMPGECDYYINKTTGAKLYHIFIYIYAVKYQYGNMGQLHTHAELNAMCPSDTIWRSKSGPTLVHSGNDLWPDSTKPLPEPILTSHW